MNTKKILHYTMQLSMLKQLLNQKLITEKEYQKVKNTLMRDYGVVSDITINCNMKKGL